MAVSNSQLRRSGRFRFKHPTGPQVISPTRPAELSNILGPNSNFSPPFRPRGANSSSTDCTSSTTGTVIDVSRMTEIRNIDHYGMTVTVQAGVRIGDLVAELAEHELELAGAHDLMSRTVGGAIAGGCIGPGLGDDGPFFSSQVESVRIITPQGKPIEIRKDQNHLLHAFRLSFGMLGVIYEAKLKVRPIRTFSVTHRRCTFEQFGGVAEKLANVDVGLKFFLMPFRDCVYLDLRRTAADAGSPRRIPWKLKDWGESTVLPHVFKSINKIVPVPSVRYRIIDEIGKATQGIVNNRLVSSGSNATSLHSSSKDNDVATRLHYSTWFFPAADFAVVVHAYRDFCQRVQDASNFRCDMPTVGFRVGRDGSALLSPSFDEPMIALRAISTQAEGWEDFVIDFSDFARHWGGIPLFNQTRDVPADYPGQAFGSRLDFFRRIRRQFDSENRMMNPFLSQYFL